MLCGGVVRNGNAVLPFVAAGGINPVICPPKVITESGLACQRDRAFAFRAQCTAGAPAPSVCFSSRSTSAAMNRMIFPRRKAGVIVPLAIQ